MPHVSDTTSEVYDPTYRQTHTPSEDGVSHSEDSEFEENEKGILFSRFPSQYNFLNPQGQPIRALLNDEPDHLSSHHYHMRVGFRVWDEKSAGTNTAHGILAGRKYPGYKPPLSRNNPEYMQAAVRHLRREKIHSPFISIWISPLSAVHKLIRSSESTEMAFINMDFLGRDTTEFPILQSAKSLTTQYRILEIGFPDGSKYRYRGDPEYLVWQDIEAHAIFSTISKAEFDLHTAQNDDLKHVLALQQLSEAQSVNEFKDKFDSNVLQNRRAGFAIGMLFRKADIPRRCVRKLAMTFAKSFGLKKTGSGSQSSKKMDDLFMTGVWQGHNNEQVRAGINVTPPSIKKESLFATMVDAATVGDLQESPSTRPGQKRERRVAGNKQPTLGSSLARSNRARPNTTTNAGPRFLDDERPKVPNDTFSTRYNSVLFKTRVTQNDDDDELNEDAACMPMDEVDSDTSSFTLTDEVLPSGIHIHDDSPSIVMPSDDAMDIDETQDSNQASSSMQRTNKSQNGRQLSQPELASLIERQGAHREHQMSTQQTHDPEYSRQIEVWMKEQWEQRQILGSQELQDGPAQRPEVLRQQMRDADLGGEEQDMDDFMRRRRHIEQIMGSSPYRGPL